MSGRYLPTRRTAGLDDPRDSSSYLSTSESPSDSPRLAVTKVETRSSMTEPDMLYLGDLDEKPTPVKRRFTVAWARKRHGKEDDEDVPGPIGLRLLHSSSEPLIDLIFVHGLRGGSIKTWRKGSDLRYFWPQWWLPMEPSFENANIHSFGYDSDWANSKPSVLNIHDFGQGLVEAIRNSPHLRERREQPIILIGHSMGGLVIKKAFVLAQDVPELKDRIRTIFFLATPHRGSDYASTLNNILAVSGIMSSRHYIADLMTGSTSIQLINDSFGKCAHEVPIFSFYETLRMSLGITSIMVVDKDSAVLGHGYKNERVQYINANHTDICKFESVNDPNYITVKNALGRAVEYLLKDVSIAKREESKQQIEVLRLYLGVSNCPDEAYPKVEGSCQWINLRDDFLDWRDCAEGSLEVDGDESGTNNLAIYWVHAKPGTGKTVLASYIISQLQDFQLECAFYFFHAGDKSSRSLSAFLRSMAYQMATSNAAIRERLSRICQEGSTFDMDDSRTIWTKLFKKGIFQAQVYRPQYWVVDALDECSKYQELFTMLKVEKPNFPIRIFITSRTTPDMQKIQRWLNTSASIYAVEIPVRDSVGDIQRYIDSRIESLPVTAGNQELASTILRKSNACFLWVRLILDELENVYSSASILEILDGIPTEMFPYYERTVRAMAANTREGYIAKTILNWVVASVRKLTISELSQALELEINTSLPNMRSAIEGLCGQLVSVDRDTGLVDLIHPTAREFLLSDAAGDFRVVKTAAHGRIALSCLNLLLGNEMRPPRNRRFLAQTRQTISPLVAYAVTQFSEHIYSASAENHELLIAIDRFFKTNVLSWVERLAQEGDLNSLIRTSKNLKAYLDRRAKYQPPLNLQTRTIGNWSIDLSRLVTQYGEALLQDPSSIFFLIPPLCPTDSAIYQQFGKRGDALSVVGKRRFTWDDCIAFISFGEDVAAAVSCGENLIAVGMESGEVCLYNHRSCQKGGVISQMDPLDHIHVADSFIALTTINAIMLLDLAGNTIWENRLRLRCLLLTSSDKYVIAVSFHGHLLKWNKGSGELLEDQPFEFRNVDVETQQNGLSNRAPHVASISPDLDMLALGYRGGTVCLWDISEKEFIGWARDDQGRLAATLLFNPNPNINLLLVIYSNHGMALFDSWSGSLVQTYSTESNVGLLSASCSPDGRTLVTMDARSSMRVWDFESLSILYHVLSPFPSFRILNFTSDGKSVVDVMDSAMRIWSPAALVRKNMEEDASISDDATPLAITEGDYEPDKTARINVLCAHQSQPIVLAGKSNGQVVAFNTTDKEPTTLLYSHPQAAAVTQLAISKTDRVASSDVHGFVQVRSLGSSMLNKKPPPVEMRIRGHIKQLCFSADGQYLLVATSIADAVYKTEDGSCMGNWTLEAHERKIWKWFVSHEGEAEGQQAFSLLADGVIRHFVAASFPTRTGAEIQLQYALDDGEVEASIQMAVVHAATQVLAIEVNHFAGLVLSSTTFLFDIGKLPPTPGPMSTAVLTPLSTALPNHCRHFVGYSEATTSFVFVHRNSWVSSISLPALTEGRYSQHFFMPPDYLSSGAEVIPVKTANDDVVFCSHGELIAVRKGFEFRQDRELV